MSLHLCRSLISSGWVVFCIKVLDMFLFAPKQFMFWAVGSGIVFNVVSLCSLLVYRSVLYFLFIFLCFFFFPHLLNWPEFPSLCWCSKRERACLFLMLEGKHSVFPTEDSTSYRLCALYWVEEVTHYVFGGLLPWMAIDLYHMFFCIDMIIYIFFYLVWKSRGLHSLVFKY